MADEPETPVTAKKDEGEASAPAKKVEAETPPPTPPPATQDEAPTRAAATKDEAETPAPAVEDEAAAASASIEDEHARNARVRRGLLLLSLANWAIALLAWTISAYLGITSPASIFVYTVLFVIGLFAATVAIATYLLEKFAHRPEPTTSEAVEGDESDAAAIPSA